MDAAIDASGGSKDEGDHQARQGELDRRGEPLRNEFRHRLMRPVRNAEIAAEEPTEEVEEPPKEWFVEMKGADQSLPVRRSRIRREQGCERVAEIGDKQEAHEADSREDNERLHDPRCRIANHHRLRTGLAGPSTELIGTFRSSAR